MYPLLVALGVRLMPGAACARSADGDLSAGDAFAQYVQSRLARLTEAERAEFGRGCARLDAEAERRFGAPFSTLGGESADALLAGVERGQDVAEWPDAPAWFQRLLHWAAEAAYAVPNAAARARWQQMGYGDRKFAVLRTPPAFASAAVAGEPDSRVTYDAVIVGAGVAGCIVAGVLAAAGLSVLLLERGDDAYERAVQHNHLENHRLSLYGHNTGPELADNPRVLLDARGQERTLLPHQNGYHNNAACIGGGGLVYGGMAWRFSPEDFRMASLYGVPATSSLADWPLSYAELAPYYERAEWEVGVAGEAGSCLGATQAKGYPMPPNAGHPGRQALVRGAQALGWRTHGVPLLINSEAWRGRAACGRCNACVGFACPTGAKNGGHNTFLEGGLRTGNVTLVTRAPVLRVESDERGRASGVSYVRTDATGAVLPSGAAVRHVRARRVVVSCGAIESARLLLSSASAREPNGLGNNSDQVGRHLQGHIYCSATGLMPEAVEDGRGPGPSVATTTFMHHNEGIIGGGVLADDFVLLPIIAWRDHLPPGASRWGRANQDFMRQSYRHLLKICGPIQEIPNPDSRVTLDARVKDRWGRRVARLSGSVHAESVRAAEFLRLRAEEWLRASGAERAWSHPFGGADFLSAGQHQAGTCRMGEDPKASVVDQDGRVHGHDNLHVIDASVHVTNGGVNPVLTVMALALRNAEAILRGG